MNNYKSPLLRKVRINMSKGILTKREKEIFELIQIDPNLNELTKKDYEKSNSLSS